MGKIIKLGEDIWVDREGQILVEARAQLKWLKRTLKQKDLPAEKKTAIENQIANLEKHLQ